MKKSSVDEVYQELLRRLKSAIELDYRSWKRMLNITVLIISQVIHKRKAV